MSCLVCETEIELHRRAVDEIFPSDLSKEVEGNRLKKIFKGDTIMQKIQENKDINITFFDKEFLDKLNLINWEEDEKIQFMKEMRTFTVVERHKILNEMLEDMETNEDT